MDTDIKRNKASLERALKAERLVIAPGAWRPLERIDFDKLVTIHDHEERFLLSVFIESLKRANRTRVASRRGNPEVTARDVVTALLMLGTAVENADVTAMAPMSKGIVKDVCPYC